MGNRLLHRGALPRQRRILLARLSFQNLSNVIG